MNGLTSPSHSSRPSGWRRLAVLWAALAIAGSAVGIAVIARGGPGASAPGSSGGPAAPATAPSSAATGPAATGGGTTTPGTTAGTAGGIAGGTTAGTTSGSGTPSLTGNGPVRAGGALAGAPPKLLGPVEADMPVTFDLTLRMASDGSVEQYLDGLYDPASPNYRKFLTAAQFGAKFGLPLERVKGVQSWATSQGFDVLGSVDQRTAIRLSATAGLLTDVFGVHLAQYLDPATGARFHAPLDQERVPAAIGDAVVGLSGLDTRPARSSAQIDTSRPATAVPADGLGPVDLAKAYDITPLYQAGYLGDGQTIAIVSFDTFKPSDIATYDKQFGIDGPAVKRVAVGTPLKKPGDGAVEVSLDIEVVSAVAPHAQILNFEGENGSVDHADLIDAIVQDGRADIVTDSWGKCDVSDYFSPGSREHGLHSLQAAVVAGMTFFIASGDHGAFDCWSNDPSDHRESVDFPSASPYSVSVGGTQLSVRTDGTYLTESGWEDFLTTGGSGGGNNPTEKRPTWQVGPGVDNQYSNGKRQSPDVSAAAAVDSAYQIYYTDTDGTASWSHVYGTSAASPFWAASMLLTRQLAEQQGVGKLGFLDPVLYALANTDQRASIFHDVTTGGNLQRPAAPGWDYATGLGSPDVTALADAIVQYLRANPAG